MKTKKFWNWTKNEETQTRILHLNGTIAEESWFDDDITPQLFSDELSAGNGDVTVWINSPGGDCVAAAQIYNMLKDYKGNVTVKIDGIAASAASVIAMAGSKVLMSPVSMLMIHNPMTMAIGNVDEMQKAIEMLDSVKDSIINAYELKTGMSRAKISHLMDSETWMDAYKAVELGFADDILFRNADEKKDADDDEDDKPKVETDDDDKGKNTPPASDPDEDTDEDENGKKENPFKKDTHNSMLFSRRDANADFVDKLTKHCKNSTQKSEGRSVDSLMERLNLIKNHI